MSKTIVNIISSQSIPSFLFIKDFYQEGDTLLFFTTKKVYKPKDYIIEALRLSTPIHDNQIETIELKEEHWPSMIQQVQKGLSKQSKLIVNTTGGTKYMSMAVQEVCKNISNAELYYVPYPRNVYLKTDGTELPIRHNISIHEYVTASKSVKYTEKKCCIPSDFTFSFFQKFTEEFSNSEFTILEKIRRNFRSQKCKIEDLQSVNNGPTTIITNPGKNNEKIYQFEQIEGIVDFIKSIGFPLKGKGLSKKEIDYLTGGWFEEYLYHLINDKIQPDDIKLGMVINQSDNTNPNDLDVVFTKGNKLFVIECKTGITKTAEKTQNAMFKDIAYKAATIRASLLGGLSEKSAICSLSNSDESFREVAKNMGISYYDRSFFTDPINQADFFNNILKHANLNQ